MVWHFFITTQPSIFVDQQLLDFLVNVIFSVLPQSLSCLKSSIQKQYDKIMHHQTPINE
jgi:hypothetical protein